MVVRVVEGVKLGLFWSLAVQHQVASESVPKGFKLGNCSDTYRHQFSIL